jgi:hypothetical protein
MNIGTNTGAMIAHLAEADPMNMLMKALMRMKAIIRGCPVKPMLPRKPAPSMRGSARHSSS